MCLAVNARIVSRPFRSLPPVEPNKIQSVVHGCLPVAYARPQISKCYLLRELLEGCSAGKYTGHLKGKIPNGDVYWK
jgi:hypothetical protein